MNYKQEKLLEFLNEVGQNAIEYQQHKDNINNILECCVEEGNIYYDNCDNEVKNLLKSLVEKQGIDFLWDNELIEEQYTHGIYSIRNELWSYNIGEIEEDFKSIEDYKNLSSGLNDYALKEVFKNCEYYISDNGYMYIDLSYDRISVILKESEFLDYVKQFG